MVASDKLQENVEKLYSKPSSKPSSECIFPKINFHSPLMKVSYSKGKLQII